MNILAIDTATTPHSISLRKNQDTISFTALNDSTQSESMFLEINSMLKTAEIDYTNLDIILCTVGPGSFTGIRIGIAAIRGIKKTLPHIQIHGLTTLEVIAYSKNTPLNTQPNTETFHVVTNAFGNELYAQKFDLDNNQKSDIRVVSKHSLLENIDTAIVSNDASIVSILKTNKRKAELIKYNAETVLECYLKYPDRAKDVKPLYIKKPNIHHGALRTKFL